MRHANHSKLTFCDLCYISQGYIQDAYIVSGPNGYLKQCPNIETQCPTCGQYSNLLKTLDDLLKKVDDLSQRVSNESSISVRLRTHSSITNPLEVHKMSGIRVESH